MPGDARRRPGGPRGPPGAWADQELKQESVGEGERSAWTKGLVPWNDLLALYGASGIEPLSPSARPLFLIPPRRVDRSRLRGEEDRFPRASLLRRSGWTLSLALESVEAAAVRGSCEAVSTGDPIPLSRGGFSRSRRPAMVRRWRRRRACVRRRKDTALGRHMCSWILCAPAVPTGPKPAQSLYFLSRSRP